MLKLTEKQLNEVALGYNWHQNMPYEEFIKLNPGLSHETGWDLYVKIDKRYCEKLNELL